MKSYQTITAVAVAAALVSLPTGASAQQTIKIGVLTSASGTLAPVGQQVRWGFELAAEEINAGGGILGRKLELLFEDDESNAQAAARRGEKLLQQDKVDFITGTIHSGATLALAQLAERNDRLAATTVSYSSNITGAQCSPNMFRVSAHAGIQAIALTTWMAANVKAKRYAIVAPDYEMGKDAGANFEAGVKAGGGEVVVRINPPLAAKDFSPYFNQLRSARPEAILTMTPGNDTVRFMTQLQEQGFIDGKLVTAGAAGAVTRGNIAALKGSAEGFLTAADYSADVDTPESKKFVAAFTGKFKTAPDLFAANSYALFYLLQKAAAKAGKWETGPMRDAIRGMEWDTPSGKRRMRAEDNQAALDMYIIKVKGTDFPIVDKVPAKDIAIPDACTRF